MFKVVLLVSLPLPLILLLDQMNQAEAKEDTDHRNSNKSSRRNSQVGLTHYYELSYSFELKADVYQSVNYTNFLF
jgi:hypothetical protein